MVRPLDPRNPGFLFRTARASVGTIRPAAPTEQPFQPPKRYVCLGCGATVELDLLAPLPDGWVTVQGAKAGEGLTYRCAGCAQAAKKGGRAS